MYIWVLHAPVLPQTQAALRERDRALAAAGTPGGKDPQHSSEGDADGHAACVEARARQQKELALVRQSLETTAAEAALWKGILSGC